MSSPLVWRELHWPLPIEAAGPLAAVRAWAADRRSPVLVLETQARRGAITYLLGCNPAMMTNAQTQLTSAVPQLRATKYEESRPPIQAAAGLRLSTRHRPLRIEDMQIVTRAILGVFAAVGTDELLVLQLLLGPRRIPLSVPNHSPSSIVMPWYQVAWMGNGGQVDGEKQAALRSKVNDHGFAASLRVGSSANSSDRLRKLLQMTFAALRMSETPGLQAHFVPEPTAALTAARKPWRWPLRLNASEALALTAWPMGEGLPGLPAVHPRQVAPTALASKRDRTIGVATAPGVDGSVGYSVTDSLRHTWTMAPTGAGKSTLLLNLIVQDLQANRSVVVIEPNDLITDLLQRIPVHRRDDIVVLDPLDTAPVGLNPFSRHGRRSDLVADGLFSLFQNLYGDSLGPRSSDILSNSLQVLAARGDATLAMLPVLLTNSRLRHQLTAKPAAADPLTAGPFWAWFNGLSDDARAQVTGPLSNKLRPILKPALRGVLAQPAPRFNVRQVLTERKVLLVPLQPGILGPDTAQLLGALVLSELWLATRERRAVSAERRRPVLVYLDEVQSYLRLPVDLADALATSRSLGIGWHLAHQYRDQLPPQMRAAFEANARSRICFQLSAADARAMAAGQSVVSAEDFTALPAYHAYASLVRGNSVQPWASIRTEPAPAPISSPADIRARSRSRYGQPLEQVLADLHAMAAPENHGSAPSTGRRRRSPS